MFEKASRLKLRFPSLKGAINVEDLWDLPLTSVNGACLNHTAVTISQEIKQLGEESFVSVKPVANTTLQLKLDIVKHVIAVKMEEAAVKAKAAETKAFKEKVMDIIAKKEDDELSGKSLEELKALLNK